MFTLDELERKGKVLTNRSLLLVEGEETIYHNLVQCIKPKCCGIGPFCSLLERLFLINMNLLWIRSTKTLDDISSMPLLDNVPRKK